MKYKMSDKIESFLAIDDWQGLGKEVAEKLEAGEAIELKSPPEHLVSGGYLVKEETKKAGGK